MFVVDAAGSEGRDPVQDLESLKEELRLYDGELAGKPAFVVANKTDLEGESGGAGLFRFWLSWGGIVGFQFVHVRCNRSVGDKAGLSVLCMIRLDHTRGQSIQKLAGP